MVNLLMKEEVLFSLLKVNVLPQALANELYYSLADHFTISKETIVYENEEPSIVYKLEHGGKNIYF